jgi:hypothetical protein
MLNKMYKIYFAVLDNKIVDIKELFIATYDIRFKVYNIWYLDSFGVPQIYDKFLGKAAFEFEWNILMNGRV